VPVPIRTILRAALGVVLVALALPGAASARAMLVAGGAPGLVSVDQSTGRVAAPLGLGGPAVALATSSDGARAYVAAGKRIATVDIADRRTAGFTPLASGIMSLASSPNGSRLLAGRAGAIDVLATAPLPAVVSTIPLGRSARPRSIAIAPDGLRALVILDGKRLAVLDLTTLQVAVRVPLTNATAVTFSPGGSAWALQRTRAGGVLRRIDVLAARASASIPLGRSIGGGLAITPNGRTAIAGAGDGSAVAAIADLTTGRLAARVRVGRGPGFPGVSSDGTRLFVADRGGRSLSVLSALSFKRLRGVALPAGVRASAAAGQGGLAVQRGTPGADVLIGTRGPDLLDGLGGDDTLSGNRSNDQLLGGDGNDKLNGGTENDLLDGGAGDDRLFGTQGNDQLLGGAGNDALFGGTGNDRLNGGDDGDYLDGGDGDDQIDGGAGDDRIVESGLGNDNPLIGGPGNDLIDGGRGTDKIYGDDGNDTLLGRSGSETIDGGTGDDTIDGGTGGDILFGREGNDAIRGDAGSDTIYGSYGDDTIDGGSGNDTISGSYGADDITGGPGEDSITGGTGNDIIHVADDSQDTVDCGPGKDTVYVEDTAPDRDALSSCETVIQVPPEPSTDAPPTTNVIAGTPGPDVLNGTEGNDSLFGADGNDELFGNGGNDYVDGENDDDILHGGPGDDELHGRGGNDVVLGNEGNDRLFGDRGNDTLDGGDGNDQIFAGLDDDTVQGGAGDDTIQVVAGGFDRVSCGPGTDTVYADATDEIAPDCEIVKR